MDDDEICLSGEYDERVGRKFVPVSSQEYKVLHLPNSAYLVTLCAVLKWLSGFITQSKLGNLRLSISFKSGMNRVHLEIMGKATHVR